MLKKVYQRLSDPVFYQRRWAMFRNRFHAHDVDERFLSELPQDRVLVVIAHPDDEVFCSGLICELVAQQTDVHVLCLTRGEGGPLPEATTRDKLGPLREAELKESCRVLGVSKLDFLDHIDPVGLTFRTFPPDVSVVELAMQLSHHFERLQPDIIITHGSWGEYWHPAHLLLHKAVMRSSAGSNVLTFQAHQDDPALTEITNSADPAHLKLDYSRHHNTRLKALEAHQSQLELFAKFACGTHVDFIEKTSREHYSVARFDKPRRTTTATNEQGSIDEPTLLTR